jgi:hypothetical protein
MKKALKREALVVIITLAALLLLATSLEATRASETVNEQNASDADYDQKGVSSTNQTAPSDNQAVSPSKNENSLSDFLLRLCEYKSRGNASELARLIREATQQEKINQAISHENPPQSPVSSLRTMETSWDIGYFETVLGYSPDQYTPPYWNPPNTLIGHVDNMWGIEGNGPDNDAEYFETTGWYESTWGEALTNGLASWQYNGLAEFHVVARSDHSYPNPPWHNYLVVEVSNTRTMGDWHLVNWIEVHSDTFADFTIGNVTQNFKYIALEVYCPANWPLETSSLFIDNVYFIEHNSPVDLTISSGDGGTTDPSPYTYEVPQGTTVDVTALPEYGSGYVFDHWDLDDINVGNGLTIPVTMDSSHTLEANFREEQLYHYLTVTAYDLYDYSPVYTPVYIDGYPAGYSFEPISVMIGWHDVGVDNSVWNQEQNRYEIFFCFFEGIGSNPTNILITSDKNLGAAYIY